MNDVQVTVPAIMADGVNVRGVGIAAGRAVRMTAPLSSQHENIEALVGDVANRRHGRAKPTGPSPGRRCRESPWLLAR